MKLSLGADHGGVHLKEHVLTYLKNQGHEVTDHGTQGCASVDYPDYAHQVARDVALGKADFGVLICTSGVGMSITANKTPGVRAALVTNEDIATFARLHNNANIICMGEKYITPYLAEKYLNIFLHTTFEGGRHERRVHKIEENT